MVNEIQNQLRSSYIRFEDFQVKSLQEKSKKLGYQVERPYFFENKEGIEFCLSVTPAMEYVPRIYIHFWKKELEVKIQTTSYGSLTGDEFKSFLKAQQNALEMKKLIEEVYKNKSLPTIVEE